MDKSTMEISEIRRLMLSATNPVAQKYFNERGQEILPSGKIIPNRQLVKLWRHEQRVPPSRLLDLQKSINARYGHPHILPSFSKKVK